MNEFFSTGAFIPLWILIGGMAFVIALLLRGASANQHAERATAPAHRDHETVAGSPAAATARPTPAR